MDDKERRAAVAAVPVYEHQAEAAQRAVDGISVKVERFENLAKAAKDQLGPAKQALKDAQADLRTARELAKEARKAGPIPGDTGESVEAHAEVASVTGEGMGSA